MLLETFLPVAVRSWTSLGPVLTAVLWAALLGSAPVAADEQQEPQRLEKRAPAKFTYERRRATKAGDELLEKKEITREEAIAHVYGGYGLARAGTPPDPELEAAIALFNMYGERVPEFLQSAPEITYERIVPEEPRAAAEKKPRGHGRYRFALERFKLATGEVVARKEITREEALAAAQNRRPTVQRPAGDAGFWQAIAEYNITLGGEAMRRDVPEEVTRIVATEIPAEDVRP